ncbi:MAG: SLC13 family permease, partial [Pleurocapsa sp. SU_196_0]|nr:SLC13 family permease [Pleurocapsa sp. SU_196_0]
MLYVPARLKDWKSPPLKTLLAPSLALGFTAAILFGTELPHDARAALLIFGLAVIGWVFTKINDTYIALGAAIALTLSGVQSSEALFSSLGDSMIWLLLAAFIVAAAVKASGLANRIAALVAARTRTVTGLFYAMTGVIL